MTVKVDEELVKKVSALARLNLTEAEVKEFVPQFSEILDAFSRLDEVDTKDADISFQPVEIKNIMREDKTEPSLEQEEALANTKHKKDGYFKGPRAV
ncbi:Asp-tRNA(Asn)/Glu-tRNA(Gln) amidotransferase subunit GatC [Candidatus Woesearchaeota archaeon]|nr:Asp-tRNA(Asn)/Glu-tRNA(Gln) amidotransferase subunit GatC [Candidatus Woesearchaeota archaeon]